jgi:hypothetical protein
MGNDHLRVGLGSKSTRFKKWLVVPYTSGINVKASLNIIDCIDNEVKRVPEAIVEDSLCLLCYIKLVVLHVELLVNVCSNLASNSGFRVTNIILTEEELSVKVRDLNVIVVSNSNLTFLTASKTHKSECLNVLTTESTSTDHECAYL